MISAHLDLRGEGKAGHFTLPQTTEQGLLWFQIEGIRGNMVAYKVIFSGSGSNSVGKVPAMHAGRPAFRFPLFSNMSGMVARICPSTEEALAGGLLELTGSLT